MTARLRPLPEEKIRAAVEIICLRKSRELRYRALCISRAIAGMILNLEFLTEDPDGVGDKLNIFLFPIYPSHLDRKRRW